MPNSTRKQKAVKSRTSVGAEGSVMQRLGQVLTSQPWRMGYFLVIGMTLMAFAAKRQEHRVCKNVFVTISNEDRIEFVDKPTVTQWLASAEGGFLIGARQSEINLRTLEAKVKESPYVSKASVYQDLAGDISATITQPEPLARILRPGQTDWYITESGKIIPESPKHTVRVLTLQTEGIAFTPAFKEMSDMGETQAIFELITAINDDPINSKLIGGIVVDRKWEITLEPIIGDQVIQFGKAENIPVKLAKLQSFYEQIIPAKGWDAYHTVKLQFENQIICE